MSANRVAELETTALVFASAVAPRLANGDHAAVRQTMSATRNLDGVMSVRVVNKAGKTVGQLGGGIVVRRGGDEALLRTNGAGLKGQNYVPTPWEIIQGTAFQIGVPVIFGGEQRGKLELVATSSALRARVVSNAIITAQIALIGVLLALLLSLWLQNSISAPIVSLAKNMTRVRDTQVFEAELATRRKGEIGALAGAFDDLLANIRRRDADLFAYQRGLEKKVADRTVELAAARDEAQAANAAKSEFLATMSHEIRTPMNGVLVMAELLSESELAPREKHLAGVICRSGRSLLAIINDILDLSKIEAGELTLEERGFSPHELVDDVTQLFWDRAEEKALGLAAHVHPNVPRALMGDATRLNQVLSNLVNNAIKFTAEGTVRVSVAMVGSRGGQQQLAMHVADTGIGIPADRKAHVFESFAQAQASTTREYGGTGLGLTICQRLVDGMGGRMTLRSIVGRGSVFSFVVPLKSDASDQDVVDRGALLMPDDVGRAAVAGVVDPAAGWALGRAARGARLLSGDGMPSHFFSSVDDAAAQQLALLASDADRSTERPLVVLLGRPGDATQEAALRRGDVDRLLHVPVTPISLHAALSSDAAHADSASGDGSYASEDVTQFAAHVLLADDNAVNQEVLREAVGRLGVTVDIADNGLEAVALFDPDRHAMVFMDLHMPEMDGFAATRELRSRENAAAREGTPIIAMTAHVSSEVHDLWRAAGMDDYVAKPYMLATLEQCLLRWLEPLTDAPAEPRLVSANENLEAEPKQSDAHADGLSSVVADAVSDEPASMAAEDIPVLDAGVLDAIRAIQGEALVARVSGLYAQRAPKQFDMLRDVVDQQAEPVAIADAAHALKSLSLNVGAQRVAEICERMECRGRAGSSENANAEVELLQHELDRTLEALTLGSNGTEAEVTPMVNRSAQKT